MSTITEKLDRLETYKSDIKAAIIDKGQDVSDNMAEYAAAIEQISGGGDDKDYSNNPDLGKKVQQTYNTFVASDGTVYISSNVKGANGVYAIKDGVTRKLLNSYYIADCFYESTDNVVYFKIPYYHETFYYIKDNIVKELFDPSTNGYKIIFESKDGTVYFGIDDTSRTYNKIYSFKYDNNNVNEYTLNSSKWTEFFECPDGTILVGSINESKITAPAGFYTIKDNVLTNIIPNCTSCNSFYITEIQQRCWLARNGYFYFTASIYNPDVYSAGSYSVTFAYKDGVVTQLTGLTAYTSDNNDNFYEASDGTVYCGRNILLKLYENTIETITQIRGCTVFLEASDGTIYIGNDQYAYTIKNGTIKTFNTIRRPTLFKEGGDGTIYTASMQGCYTIKEGVASQLQQVRNIRGFYEASDGTVYIYVNKTIYSIYNNVETVILSNYYCDVDDRVYKFNYLIEQNGKVYISGYNQNNGIYELKSDSSELCNDSENYKWLIYNGVFISDDTEHKYQYDLETQTKIDRIIELPKSKHYFLDAVSQVVTDTI